MADNSRKSNIPDTWSEIPEEKRIAILEMAEGNLFWKNAAKRFGSVGKMAQIVLAVLALWMVFKDNTAAWIQSVVSK